MKYITVLLVFVGMTSLAQVKGNKEITTTTIDTKGLVAIEMGLYANVTIDQRASNQMVITTDSNLQELIDKEIVDGVLKLTQLEWIQPSARIKITIGASNLERLQVGVNETVLLKNINKNTIDLMAINGKIIVSGKAFSVGISAENGTVDASKLEVEQATVNIWGNGKAIVNATDLVESKLDKDARLELVREPAKINGDTNTLSGDAKSTFAKARYINIKIKNNSFNRNHFSVKGPKQDRSYFVYGFPMMPGASKKERWTVGTKIYKVNSIGLKKHLLTITAADEGKTIKLFKD
ncbi:hypothetical protein EAX61_09385 [Dokdonia sinensis]|uniref:Putative auto-transporter adhesin head GIN domain-containing protein n=1 Tax=Dokdonia sinensis TaxID=2479847 RepID=A0A3M0GBS7_9FLAO|nr:DUF2807 domain-containing protein [Dokdonia sinensis]RMB58509.1 hypothetical protein EAX61_09385 [Dokdonia sinensis]